MNSTIKPPMPVIRKVTPIRDFIVRVEWGKTLRPNLIEDIDLSPLISIFKFYKPLRLDKSIFRTVHIIEFGNAIAWGDDDAIDMSASSIEELADEAMTPDDFRAFLSSNSLTQEQAALVLGRSRRQIAYYVSGESLIPRIVSLACYGYLARKQRGQLGTPVHSGSYYKFIDAKVSSPSQANNPTGTVKMEGTFRLAQSNIAAE